MSTLPRAALVAALSLLRATFAWRDDVWGFDMAQSSINYTALFGPGLSSGATIYYPGQPGYNTSTVQRASIWEQPTYAVAIKPAVQSDIQHIITTANAHNLYYLATGGGHGTDLDLGKVKQAVNIDLSNFIQNELDAENNTLTLGPAVIFADFETTLYNAGKIVPIGNANCVNMIGATIGAGVGPFQGMYGLIIDSLLSVTMVTSNGTVVTACESENSDLFWAIRGAGANFGIITSATYRVYDVVNRGMLTGADFAYTADKNLSVWNLLKTFDNNKFPKEMGITVAASYNHTTNQSAVAVSMSYLGTQAQAQPIINQFNAIGPVAFVNKTVSWNNLNQTEGFSLAQVAAACLRGTYTNHYAIGINQTDPQTYMSVFNNFTAFSKGRTWYNGVLSVQLFNTEKTLAVPKSQQGVYPGRQFSTLYMIENIYDGPAHDSDVYNFSNPLRSALAATSGFGTLQTYINYDFGDEGPAIWYGEKNLPRLVALKKRWDPQNRFGPANPVPLSL